MGITPRKGGAASTCKPKTNSKQLMAKNTGFFIFSQLFVTAAKLQKKVKSKK
jgi:hypothetical protein